MDDTIPGVDDDVPRTVKWSDETKIKPTNVERTSGQMNVRRQPRKEHNHKNYDNVFVITDKTQNDDFILMQLKYKKDSGTFDVTKDVFNEVKAKYMFLTETLGWKESIDGMKNATSEAKHMMSQSWPNTCS